MFELKYEISKLVTKNTQKVPTRTGKVAGKRIGRTDRNKAWPDFYLLLNSKLDKPTNYMEVLNDSCPLCVQFLISTPWASALRLLSPKRWKAVCGWTVLNRPHSFPCPGFSSTGSEVLKPIS